MGQKAHAEQNQTGDRSQVEGGRNPRTSPVPWHPVPYAAFLDGQERRGMYGVSCPKPRHGVFIIHQIQKNVKAFAKYVNKKNIYRV